MDDAVTGGAPLLEVRALTKSFGNLRAVDGLDLEVGHGELVGVAGPNGAGKSTVFNLLSATPFRCTSGTVNFEGRRIERASPRAICRAGLVRTFQSEAVFATLTAADNVSTAARFGGPQSSRRERRLAVSEALELVGLDGKSDVVADELAIDHKKRLMVATALVCKPKLLLLDEPASGLNESEQGALIDLIRRISGQGIAVMVIEHVLSLLMEVAERLIIMAAGRVLVAGAPKDVLADPRVIEAYVGGGTP